MVKAGLSVVLLDRGEFPGAKNMFGGIIYRHELEELIPGCTQERTFPVERHITEQRYWLLGPESVVSIGHKHERFNSEPYNAWSTFRVKFDPWLAGDRKSTRLNSSHVKISYAVFCLTKK